MRCPKCGYTSFAYAERCRKCGREHRETREPLGLYGLPPTPPDLMLGTSEEIDVAEASSSPAIDLSQLAHLDLALVDDPEASDLDAVDARQPPKVPLQETATDASEPTGTVEFELPDDAGDVTPIPLEYEHRSLEPLEFLPTFELGPAEESELLIAEPDAESSPLAPGAGVPERAETDAEEYVLEIEDVLELEIDEIDLKDEEDDSGR